MIRRLLVSVHVVVVFPFVWVYDLLTGTNPRAGLRWALRNVWSRS